MSEVERVDVYTRQSLYAVLWAFEVAVLLRADAEGILPGRRPDVLLLVAVGLLTTVAGTRVLRRVIADRPEHVPWDVAWPLPVLALGAAAVFVSYDEDVRVVAALLVIVPVAFSLSGVTGPLDTAATVVTVTVYAAAFSWTWELALGALVLWAFFAFTVRVSLWVLEVVAELDRSRDVGARLAVAEERLRFSRDVHDVLGRRLSTIAVTSELAATLATRGDQRAPQQMMEVRDVAHVALREARELARGYRPTELATELEGARSLLRSAGIDLELAVDDVPATWHEPAAWVIREAVTNVLRHSSANRVGLTWRDDVLTIENDGARPRSGDDDGSGLVGLRERLAPLGATVETDHDGARFALLVRFPDRSDDE